MLKNAVTNPTPILVILGGIGPAAGCILHNMIIQNTIVKTTRDHLTVLHISDGPHIYDGSQYLNALRNNEEWQDENPGKLMGIVARNAALTCKLFGRTCIMTSPCNTWHSPQIHESFTSYFKDWNKENFKEGEPGHTKYLHMPNICAEYASNQGYKTVGVMSTNGTSKQKLYRNPMEAAGTKVVEVDDVQTVEDCIYNPEYGLQNLNKATPITREFMLNSVKHLKEVKGAEAVIMGCTDLPIGIPERTMFDIEMIDPMLVLARRFIQEADPSKLTKL